MVLFRPKRVVRWCAGGAGQAVNVMDNVGELGGHGLSVPHEQLDTAELMCVVSRLP